MTTSSSPRLFATLAATLLSAIATVLSELKVPKAVLLLEHYREVDVFPPYTLLFVAALGFAIYRSIPGGFYAAFVRGEDLHHKAFAAYGPVAGALVGWIAALTILQFFNHGTQSIPLVIAVWSQLLFLVGVPVASYAAACKIIAQYGDFGSRSTPRPMLVKATAFLMCAISLGGFAYWYAV